MNSDEANWLRTNLKLSDDWIVYNKEYKTAPLVLNVRVAFVGTLRCPVCGKECPSMIPVRETGGIWTMDMRNAWSSPKSHAYAV